MQLLAALQGCSSPGEIRQHHPQTPKNAVRLGWLEQDPSHRLSDYGSHKAAAWDGFYRASPTRCRELCVGALHQLVDSAIAA